LHIEQINEPIKVRADFQGGEIRPLRFKRGGREHRIKSVNAHWETREGRRKLHYFSVTIDSGDVCQLFFNNEELVWWLDTIMMAG
jgi:hypothetical protein